MFRGSAVAVLAAALLARPIPALAQIPSVPVLQNAFTNPGVTVAANFGTADNIRNYGAAAAWAPASGRLQVSAGAGIVDPDEGDTATGLGARIAVPVRTFRDETLGVGLFGGAGFAKSEVWEFRFPIGASAAYRRALGTTRAISVHASPFVLVSTCDCDALNVSGSALFRISFGVDVIVMPGLGLTLGYEAGANAKDADAGPRSGVFGIGVSYAFRRPR